MSDSDSLIPQHSLNLDIDIINKLFISGSILPFNPNDLIDTNTRLDNGSSQFEVRQYRYNPVGLDMAVKRLQLPRKRKNDKNQIKTDKLIKEAKILSQLKDSNDIVEFYGFCFDRDYVLLCMELMDMNLSELNKIILKFKISCPSDILEHIAVQIIDGLEYCHRKNIIHRDIKPENILFKRSGKIKVGDFSESRVIDATITGNYQGTLLYWSPEKVRSTEVKDPKYDIWGLGITLLEFICGFHPYKKLLGLNPDPIKLMQFIENIHPETLLQGAHIQEINQYGRVIDYTKEYANGLKLIGRCLKRVDERATIDELQNTSYYKNAQERCRSDKSIVRYKFGRYEKQYKILFEENFRKLNELIFEENSRSYNLSYLELKFRLLLLEEKSFNFHEMYICYYANIDKWIILKNYLKFEMSSDDMVRELKIFHKFARQPFILQFYGWGSIEHNMISSYGICFEVMDMNLREFYNQFINNFGYRAFKHSLSEGILGYISCVVLNALMEIRIKGFAHHNINSYNILLNDRGEIKLCGFRYASKYKDIYISTRNTYPSDDIPAGDVWCYAATLIEFACGYQPFCFERSNVDFLCRDGIDPEEEIELKEMSKNCFSMRYSHQPHEFFMECLKQQFVPNFDALMQMDFYQETLKNIEENKAHLAKRVQEIIIAETRDTVPARWFHKFMDPENAKIYDTSNDYQWDPHVKRARLALVRRAPHAKRARLC